MFVGFFFLFTPPPAGQVTVSEASIVVDGKSSKLTIVQDEDAETVTLTSAEVRFLDWKAYSNRPEIARRRGDVDDDVRGRAQRQDARLLSLRLQGR